MADKIKIRRGDFVDLPNLDEAEFGLATDTGTLYIGTDSATNILINPVLENGDGYSIDGYLIPATDNVHNLGTPDNRWASVYVGPGTINIVSKDSDAGFATNTEYRIGIDSTTGTLQIVAGDNDLLMVLDADTGVTFPSGGSVAPDPGLVNTVTEHYNQQGQINQSILQALDAYGEGLTEIEHYTQISEAIQTILKDLDGYQTQISSVDVTFQENKTQQAQINQSILQALDAYGQGQTEGEHYVQQGEINDTIIQALDGYQTQISSIDITFQENKAQQAQINQSVLQALDGYTPDITFQENKASQRQINQSILQALDGYAVVPDAAAISDGYVSFFIDGGKQIAGDNDLYWDRVNNRLGIGTVGNGITLPAAKLEVADNNPTSGLILKVTQSDHNTYGIIIGNDTFSTTDTDGMAMYVDNSGVSVTELRGTGARYSVQVGGGEAIRILNNRNIGFGTASPQNKVDIEGALAVGATFSGTNTAPTNGAIIEGNTSIGTASSTNRLDISGAAAIGASYAGVNTAPSNGAIIEGNVGIGIASPDQTLHVHKASAGTVNANSGATIVMENNGNNWLHALTPNTAHSGMLFGGPDDSLAGAVQFNAPPARGGISLVTGAGLSKTPLVASVDGLVGIRTSTPIEALTVAGTLALQELAVTEAPATQDGYGKIYVRDDDTLHYKNGPGVDQIILTSSLPFNAAGADGYLAFYTNTATLAGDNDLYYDRIIGALNVFGGTAALKVGDSDFGFDFVGGGEGTPHITFDSGDRIRYIRSSNSIFFDVGGSTAFSASTANFVVSRHLIPGADDTYDIGIGGSTQWRNGYFTSGLIVGFSAGATADEVQIGDAAFKLDFDSGGASVPGLQFDASDTITYNRTSNYFTFNVGATEIARIATGNLVNIGGKGTATTGAERLAVYSDTFSQPSAVVEQRGSAGSVPPLEFRRTNGTLASRTAVTSGDVIGAIDFRGFDTGGVYRYAGRLEMAADGTVGSDVMPGRFSFFTTNTSGYVERMRITNTGRVGINNTNPQAMLDVAGDGYFDGYLMPTTDDTWGLGTPNKRWRDLYLGPGSLHINTTSGQTGQAKEWAIGTDETGRLTVSAAGSVCLKIDVDHGTLNLGQSTVAYPTEPEPPGAGTPGIVMYGTTADYRMAVQDGNGRVNHYWNAYDDAGLKFQINSEYAVRYRMDGSSGGHIFYVSNAGGTAGAAITWLDPFSIDLSGYLWLMEQSSSPGTPTSGYANLYTKTDGHMYHKNDAGEEHNMSVGYIMAASYVSATTLTAPNSYFFPPVGLTLVNTTATEADHRIKLKGPGTITGIRIQVSTNTLATANGLMTLRINGTVQATITITVGGGTGEFTTATNVSFADGDYVCWQFTSAGATGSVVIKTIQFTVI